MATTRRDRLIEIAEFANRVWRILANPDDTSDDALLDVCDTVDAMKKLADRAVLEIEGS